MMSHSSLPLFPEQTPMKGAVSLPFGTSLLALSAVKGLGTQGLRKLFDLLEADLDRIWTESPRFVHELLARARVPSADKVLEQIVKNATELVQRGEEEAEKLARDGVRIIPRDQLPSQLTVIPDAPRWLFVQGNAEALYHRPAVAVVGTRRPSSAGLRAAASVVRMLAPYPIMVISGLAEGIDEEAHKVSLVDGVTNVAFLGFGIRQVFPAKTKHVRERIVEAKGAIATEYLPHEHYQKPYFVERNRLQAALADMVIPVEASQRGGTAHTIRFARKYDRRILGLRWMGANDILTDLERAGDEIVEVFTQSGRKKLDRIFRQLAENGGHSTFALAMLERRLMQEVESRNVRPEDLERFTQVVRNLMKQV